MKKTRILIASVLKPVNDTRMFEKIGSSLAHLPYTDVHIAGYAGVLPKTNLPITFHPFKEFKRLSWGRVKTQWEMWQLLRRIKPDLLIVSTHELLLVALVFKLFFKKKIWYDVRENYFLNLTTQQFYGGLSKRILAYTIRLIERLSAPFISQFLLAEQSYAQELSFVQHRFVILENKFIPPANNFAARKTYPVKINNNPIKLLYSGTISEMHGIFEAIELCRQLHQEHASVTLTIMGYCAIPETLVQIRDQIKSKPYITLIGGDKLVPHSQIVNEISTSQVGLLPYQPHPSTFRCIPTKLFEYLANGLPVLVQENPYWVERVNSNQAGIMLHFKNFNAAEILKKLKSQEFYPAGPPEEAFWKTEEIKLISLFRQEFKHL
ncbi:glycosyltransferase [Adhaeribacter swui]|uniref:Glycosyltransferase n=1 Tax=Adhaeribacter swui TaxID=2086471 RepID=A0A7G7GCG5_9BACT|nr:glycosyltransferase [Adhaeribacter swui]QNF34849.1 glycosyltransferase [Adhaeribacter swui]